MAMEGKLYKGRKVLERIVFPAILLIYPLLLIHQGIDVSDTTYSLGYYRFMEEMDITWVLATYLANVAGAFLMKLPMGDTLLGMNFYTGLLAAAIALICYYAISKWMPACLVFLGEVIALSLCWCPTTILYNYLTYFFFAAGAIFLCKALIEEKDMYFLPAGICLGLNVMVRFPNLTEAALIVVVWYAGWLNREKIGATIKRTGLCLVGYFIGLGSVLCVIMIKYGGGAFGGMIESLFGMTGEASDYTLAGMILSTFSAYAAGLKWMAYMLPCIGAGLVMFAIRKGRHERVKKLLYCVGILVLLRFYWGRGMFSFRYYNEGCIFQWMMLFLILTIICCALEIGGLISGGEYEGKHEGKHVSNQGSNHVSNYEGSQWSNHASNRGGGPYARLRREEYGCKKEKILAAAAFVILLITPLGSNNYTYQNMNNMFFLAPYTLWACWRIWLRTRGKSLHFPWQAFAAAILLMTLVQGIGFGCNYVFRDGIYGEARSRTVENSPVLKGMYTAEENAKSLTELIDFCQESGVGNSPILLWGDAPGLSYILDVPSAIFTTWPEIPSNTYEALNQALLELDWNPDIILHNESGKAIVEGEKTDLILDYIAEHRYTCIFENSCYKVYRADAELKLGGKT